MSNTDEEFITRRIYAIKCDLDNIIYYVGSTKKSLKGRFDKHKRNFKGWPGVGCNVSVFIKFNELGIGNFSIGLLKEYHNIDKKGIFAMETLWICKMKKTINCNILNEITPFIISRKAYDKYYYSKNKENISNKNKISREKNKKRYYCELCDIFCYRKADIDKHNNTNKHKINSGEMKEEDIIKTYNYKCNYCKLYTNGRGNFIKHLKSKEHIDIIEIVKQSEGSIVIDFQYKYNCEECNFYSDDKFKYNSHCKSKSHIQLCE
jgi:hypothetical protein